MVLVAGRLGAFEPAAPGKLVRAIISSVIILYGIVFGVQLPGATGMKILASRSWGHDGFEGFALPGFLFGFVALLYGDLWR